MRIGETNIFTKDSNIGNEMKKIATFCVFGLAMSPLLAAPRSQCRDIAFIRSSIIHNENGGIATKKQDNLPTLLFMGKGFNRAKNKQAELAKKMAMAKEEKQLNDPTASFKTSNEESPNKQLHESNMDNDQDRQEFAKLLSTTRGAIPTEDDTDSPYIATIKAGQSQKQKLKKSKPMQQRKKKKPIISKQQQSEDENIAQRIHFESLIEVDDTLSNKPLGPIGAAQLVPWVPPYLTDCLVVFADPRTNSGDLRQALKYLSSNLRDNEKFTKQVIFITADSVQETQSYLQRNGLETSIRIFSDSQLAWMTKYKIIDGGDENGNVDDNIETGGGGDFLRWSMSMLVFDTKGKMPQPILWKVDPSHATQRTLEAMRKMTSQQQ